MKYLVYMVVGMWSLFGFLAEAQNVGEAKALLDKLSEKTKSYETVEVAFSFLVTNKEQDIREERKGKLKMKGEKYVLEMDSLFIVCNGKQVTSYSREMNEAQVIPVDELDEDALTPESMFTIYEEGFKSRIREEKVEDGRKITVVDLYPLEPKEKDYTIVRLDIDEEKMRITRAVVIGKNGTLYSYTIHQFKPNGPLSEAEFEFNESDFPGVTVIE